MKRIALLAALGLAMVACSTTPYAAPAGKPTANITISRGQMASNQDAHLFHRSQDWGDPQILGTVTPFTYDVSYPIEAEVPTIIATDLMTRARAWNSFCASHISFTPKTGQTYRVMASGYGETNCITSVVDTATNAPPADARKVDPPKK